MQSMVQLNCQNWKETFLSDDQIQATMAIENGKVVYLPFLNFHLLPFEDKLLSSFKTKSGSKNISFNCHTHQLRGIRCSQYENENLAAMMQRFQQSAHLLIQQLFPAYVAALEVGRTSFRPLEIADRIPKSYRKDDTRLHVDAFPSSPNQGKRILRVFSNINPHGTTRHWRIGEPFEQVAKRFLPFVKKPWIGRGKILKTLRLTRSYATEYDYIMLQLHNLMKADLGYQKTAQQSHVHFPAATSWVVQTDHVSHAAMSGQFVLEQTFYLPVHSMLNPQLSPLRTLEHLLGRQLV